MVENAPDQESFWEDMPSAIQDLFTQLGLGENTSPLVLEAVGWGLQHSPHLMRGVPGIDVRQVQHYLGNWLQNLINKKTP